jgi:hypothetical protein
MKERKEIKSKRGEANQPLLPQDIIIEALKRSKVMKASPFHPERVAANAKGGE